MKAGKEQEIVAVVELEQIVLRQPRYEINTVLDLPRQNVSLQPSFLRTTTDYGEPRIWNFLQKHREGLDGDVNPLPIEKPPCIEQSCWRLTWHSRRAYLGRLNGQLHEDNCLFPHCSA